MIPNSTFYKLLDGDIETRKHVYPTIMAGPYQASGAVMARDIRGRVLEMIKSIQANIERNYNIIG